jgi:hypothetical protein
VCVLARGAAMKSAVRALERHTGPPEAIRQRGVGQRDHCASRNLDIPMQIAYQVPKQGRLLDVVRMRNEHIFGRSCHNVDYPFCTMQYVARLKHEPRRQLERKLGSIRRSNDATYAPAVVRRHRQLYAQPLLPVLIMKVSGGEAADGNTRVVGHRGTAQKRK